MLFKKISVLMVGVLLPIMATAQFVAPKYKPEKKDTLTSGQQFAFHTNTVAWALMTPNIGIEYDLSPSPYNRFTLLLSARYNWETNPKIKTYNQYNLLEGKLELRKYWHTRQRSTPSYSGLQGLFSPERLVPRYWRAYYFGVYVAGGSFDFKFSKTGKRGTEAQAGISLGMVRELFTYKNSSLDLDVGVSAGALWWKGNKYVLDKDANEYVDTEKKTAVMPMLQDVRVSLVYRFGPSARKRYNYNQVKADLKDEKRSERQKLRAEKKEAKDSLKVEKKKDKQMKKAEKTAEKVKEKAAKTAEKQARKDEKMRRKYEE
ncbi:MAG: DUF3575 domain-containing protein [Bacteroidaceae bacterium]|nr:DUF3575 domain-containing protein [Bacteroidaceae bacterium]